MSHGVMYLEKYIFFVLVQISDFYLRPIPHISAPISHSPLAGHREPTRYDPTPGLRRGRGRLRWRADTGTFVCARGVG